MLVLTTGGLCLLAPRWLLVAVPAAALNLLSAYDLQHTIQYHYWIVAAGPWPSPARSAPAASGRARARTWLALGGGGRVPARAPLAPVGRARSARQIRFEWPHRADRQAVLDAIPDGARVAAPMHALSHLAEREHLYVVPEPLIAVRVGTEWGAAERERATERARLHRLRPGHALLGRADRRAGRAGDRAPRVPRGHAARRDAALPAGSPGREPSGRRADRRTLRLRARARARTSGASPGTRSSRTRSRPPGSRASSSASSSRPTARRSRRSRAGTAPTCRSFGPTSTRPRRRPTSNGSPGRCPGSTSATTCSRSSARPTRSAGRTRSGAASSSCSRRPRPTRSAPSSASSSIPGKMWELDDRRPDDAAAARPVPPRRRLARGPVPGAAAGLRPEQRARDRLDAGRRGRPGTREGRVLAPFLTEGYEGLNIDDEDDFARAEELVASGRATLPAVEREPYPARSMKLASLETLSCDAGWRPWLFVKATTDDGLVGWSEVHRLARLPDRARRRRARPRAARRRTRPARGRGDPLGPLPAHAAEPRLDRPEGDRRDRERAPRPEGEGARRLGRRALRRADAGDDPALLVALRHDARTRVGGDRHAEARLVRRGRRARPRGRRAGLRRVQDEHRRPGRRAARADARLRPRRRHRPQPDARAARRADAAARGVPRGHGRQGAADRRPQLQPHDRGDRARRAARSSRSTSPGSRSTRTTPPPSRTHGAARRFRSARARTSTPCAASGRTSRRGRWTSPRST